MAVQARGKHTLAKAGMVSCRAVFPTPPAKQTCKDDDDDDDTDDRVVMEGAVVVGEEVMKVEVVE